jgi:hypothetical protein
MTKKHFNQLAAAVTTLRDGPHKFTPDQLRALAIELASVCAAANPHFDRARFLRACGVLS